MSLEDMNRKWVRKIKKRNAKLAKEGTAPKEEQNVSGMISASQVEAIKASEAKRFPESDGGIPCREPGCNTWITGTLDDVVAHRATHE
jgi:hypothetical protein